MFNQMDAEYNLEVQLLNQQGHHAFRDQGVRGRRRFGGAGGGGWRLRGWRHDHDDSTTNSENEDDEDRYNHLRDLHFQEQRRHFHVNWTNRYHRVDRAEDLPPHGRLGRRGRDEWRRMLNQAQILDQEPELVPLQENGNGDQAVAEAGGMLISDLPNEMLKMILGNLSAHDLISSRHVSKSWNDIGCDVLGADFFALKLAFRYCDSKTLYNCRLVNKKWKAIASGVLREDPKFSSEDEEGNGYFALSDRDRPPSTFTHDRHRSRRTNRIFSTSESIKDLPISKISSGLGEQILPLFASTAGYQFTDLKLQLFDEDNPGPHGRKYRPEQELILNQPHRIEYVGLNDFPQELQVNIGLPEGEIPDQQQEVQQNDDHIQRFGPPVPAAADGPAVVVLYEAHNNPDARVSRFVNIQERRNRSPGMGLARARAHLNNAQPIYQDNINPEEAEPLPDQVNFNPSGPPMRINPLRAQWTWAKLHGLLMHVPNLRKLHLHGFHLPDDLLARVPGPQQEDHKLEKLEELIITLPVESNIFCINILQRFMSFVPDTLRSLSIYSFRDSLHECLPELLMITREFASRTKLYHRTICISGSSRSGDMGILKELIDQDTVPVFCSQLTVRLFNPTKAQVNTFKTFLEAQSENCKSMEIHVDSLQSQCPVELPKLPQLQTLIIRYAKLPNSTPPGSMIFVPFVTHQFPALQRVDLRDYFDSQRLFTSCLSDTVRSLTISFGSLEIIQVERWDYVFPNLIQLNVLSCPHGYLGFIFKYLTNLWHLSVHVTQEFQYEDINSTLTGFNVPGREFLEFMDYYYQVDENREKLLVWIEKLRVKTGSNKPTLLDMKQLKTLDITFGQLPAPGRVQALMLPKPEIDVEMHKPLSDPGVYMSLLLLEPLDCLTLNLTDFSEECSERLVNLHKKVQIW